MAEFFNHLSFLLNDIIQHPANSAIIILNLIIIESLLSVDNAAVLATMVMDLPEKERKKALRYGIWGAYFFRGLALIFAAVIIKIWWLKPLGGFYLLWLVYDWWIGKRTVKSEDDLLNKESNWLYKNTVGLLGNFWATVLMVELMDIAFSIDNVFAAVAFTPNLVLVCTGVFIGILSIRFIANWFVKLMQKFPFLETSAFIVIGILGLKLSLSLADHYFPQSMLTKIVSSHYADAGVSLLTALIFFVPIVTSYVFNIPKVNKLN